MLAEFALECDEKGLLMKKKNIWLPSELVHSELRYMMRGKRFL